MLDQLLPHHISQSEQVEKASEAEEHSETQHQGSFKQISLVNFVNSNHAEKHVAAFTVQGIVKHRSRVEYPYFYQNILILSIFGNQAV